MKLPKSPNQLRAEQEQKRIREAYNDFKRGVRSDISENGLTSVRYRLEMYEQNPSLRTEQLSNDQIRSAFNEVLDTYQAPPDNGSLKLF